MGENLKESIEKKEEMVKQKDFNIVLYGTLGCGHCIEMMNRVGNVIKKHSEIKFRALTPEGSMKRIPVTKFRYGNDLVKTINGAIPEDELNKLIEEFIEGKMEKQPRAVEEAETPKPKIMGPASPIMKKITITLDARTLGLIELKPENTVITEVPTLLKRVAFIISKQLEEPRNI